MRKINFKKAIAGISAALTLCTTVAAATPVTSFAANGTAQEACDIAKGYLNNPQKYTPKTDNWCVEFALACISEAGVDVSSVYTLSTNKLLTNFYNTDKTRYHSRSNTAWSSDHPNPTTTIEYNYTPQPGDLVFIQNDWRDPEPDHTALVVSVSGTGINATVTTIEGNYSNTIKSCTYTNGKCTAYTAEICGYATPEYKASSTNNVPSTPTTPTTPTGSIYRVYDTNNKQIAAYSKKDNAYNMLKKNSSAKYMTKDNVKLTGDLDLSGAVDMTDLSYLSLYRVGDTTFEKIAKDNGIANPEVVKYNADVTGDGKVDLCDLATLRRIISKQQ